MVFSSLFKFLPSIHTELLLEFLKSCSIKPFSNKQIYCLIFGPDLGASLILLVTLSLEDNGNVLPRALFVHGILDSLQDKEQIDYYNKAALHNLLFGLSLSSVAPTTCFPEPLLLLLYTLLLLLTKILLVVSYYTGYCSYTKFEHISSSWSTCIIISNIINIPVTNQFAFLTFRIKETIVHIFSISQYSSNCFQIRLLRMLHILPAWKYLVKLMSDRSKYPLVVNTLTHLLSLYLHVHIAWH